MLPESRAHTLAAIATATALCFASLWAYNNVFAPPALVSISLEATLRTEERLGARAAALDAASESDTQQATAQDPASLESIAACESFACLRRERKRLGVTQFNFPHFFIIGLAKCATTSLAGYLKRSPDILLPRVRYSPWYPRSGFKEAHFFDKGCNPTASRPRCDPTAEKYYVQSVLRLGDAARGGFGQAAFDATPTYVKHDFEGVDLSLAALLHKELPWLRLVLSVREPISQGISYCHHQNHIRDAEEMAACLVWRFKRVADDPDAFHSSMLREYSRPVATWLREFPASQLHVIQYERLIDDSQERATLRNLTDFLGLRPVDESLREQNVRKDEDTCWPIGRRLYLEIAALARADALKLAGMLGAKGLADAGSWMAAWEAVWAAQLATCGADDVCCLAPS